MPDATPWLPTKECLAALSGLGDALNHRLVGPKVLALARFSLRVGVDVAKVSDDDIIAIRSDEELFSTWRRFVAELCLEADWLAIDQARDVVTLVQAKQVLWRAEPDRQIGRGGALSDLFDANAIARGLITGGVATGSGMAPGLTAASALGWAGDWSARCSTCSVI